MLGFDYAHCKAQTLAAVLALCSVRCFGCHSLSDHSPETAGALECGMDHAPGTHALGRLSDLVSYLRQFCLVRRRMLAIAETRDEERRASR